MLRRSLPRVLCDGISEAGAAERVQGARGRANNGGSKEICRVHKVSFLLIVPLLVGIIIGPQVARLILYTPSYFLGSLTSFILSLRNGQNIFHDVECSICEFGV